jgi:hypothetical protein
MASKFKLEEKRLIVAESHTRGVKRTAERYRIGVRTLTRWRSERNLWPDRATPAKFDFDTLMEDLRKRKRVRIDKKKKPLITKDEVEDFTSDNFTRFKR